MSHENLQYLFAVIKQDSGLKHAFLEGIMYLSYLDGRQSDQDILMTIIHNHLLEMNEGDYRVLHRIQRNSIKRISVRRAIRSFHTVYDSLPDVRARNVYYGLCVALLMADDTISEREGVYLKKIGAKHTSTSTAVVRAQAVAYLTILRQLAWEKFRIFVAPHQVNLPPVR